MPGGKFNAVTSATMRSNPEHTDDVHTLSPR